MSSSSPKVIVVGASGYVGKSTLSFLTAKSVQVFAGVRDPSKLADMEGVAAVKADMGDKAELTKALSGYDSAFLVIPGHENRTELGINGLEAAKDAGVKFVLLLSVLTSGTDSVFGRQFGPLEEKAKTLGVDYAIVRLPIFMDNQMAQIGAIKDQGTFYDPRDPDVKFTDVSVADIGKVAATILVDPSKHTGKTYRIVAPSHSNNDLAAALTKTLGKEVKVTTVSYADCKASFMGMGFPEWQVDGIMELYKFMDDKSELTNDMSTDVNTITGEPAMSVEAWAEQNAAAFK